MQLVWLLQQCSCLYFLLLASRAWWVLAHEDVFMSMKRAVHAGLSTSVETHSEMFVLAGGLCTQEWHSRSLLTGIAASFAVKLFKAWMAEKDANSVTSSLRKANLDKRLLVSVFASSLYGWRALGCCRVGEVPGSVLNWSVFLLFILLEKLIWLYTC